MEILSRKIFLNSRQSYEEWIVESVEFFRQLGFFGQWRNLPTEKLICKLEQLQEESGLARYQPMGKTADFDLIAWDKKKVWYLDADALVLPQNEAYVQALQELAAISRKQLSLTFVQEEWEGEEGPIRVHFTNKRKQYEFYPRYHETYFDYGTLAYLNTFVEDRKFRFELCGDILENPIALFLHKEEKELLSVKRGWKFKNF